jgi:peptidoglycan/xylan/chitin deacetylase (PgdA/CDA1 family)/lysophospholipase L1-like esterase
MARVGKLCRGSNGALGLRLVACTASVAVGVAAAWVARDVSPSPALAWFEDAAIAPPEGSRDGPSSAASPAPPRSSPKDSRALRLEESMGERFKDGKIIRGTTPHRLLLFTFDDGPDLRHTPAILDVLDERGVKAVFFPSSGRIQLDSRRGRQRAAIVRDMVERGHMLGDHTVDHALLISLTSESAASQMQASQDLFMAAVGARPWLFRPPGGRRDARIDALIADEGYTQLLWNLGGADHVHRSARDVVRAFRAGLDRQPGGGVVLLHDTHEWTKDALPAIFDEVERRNCELLARGEELYDIVDDPAFFFAARGEGAPDAEAPPAELHPVVLRERQAIVRARTERQCGLDAPAEDGSRGADDAVAYDGPRIHDPSGALFGFFEALARAEDPAERAIARVTHMGDSNLNRDDLPGFLRERFQRRFGDAGAGFVVMQPATEHDGHRGVRQTFASPWSTCSLLDRCAGDGRYGLGGVVASSRTVAETRFAVPTGTTRVELWYATRPRGGTLEMSVDGTPVERIATRNDGIEDRWFEHAVAPGTREVRVRSVGTGPVRAYGVVFEGHGPGVVWDTISMTGAFTSRVLDHDETHFAEQLRRRRTDLVILHYGGNDLRRYLGGVVTAEAFAEETRALLRRVREARPGMACLLTGIGDHGKSGPMRVLPQHLEPLLEAQRTAARDAGCAFFDTYRAMGGPGAIYRWYRQGLAAGDLVHLTRDGRRLLAEWLYDALMNDYESYRRARAAGP